MSPGSILRTIGFVVTGRVQGVAFRAYTRDRARELGLRGHVFNRQDGAVEGVASGDSADIDAFIAFLHEGSPWARVATVTIDESPAPDTAADLADPFSVRRS